MYTPTETTDTLSLPVVEPLQDTRNIHTIPTAEGTTLEVRLAGIGNRMMAYTIDSIIYGLILLMLGVLLFILAIVTEGYLIPEISKTIQEFAVSIAIIVPLALTLSYHTFQEWLWGGQTIGKAAVGIHVVRRNGQPIGFWESFGRNTIRMFEIPFMVIGIWPMLLSPLEQRFGDFLANTIVVENEQATAPQDQQFFVEGEPLPHLLLLGKRLDGDEFQLINQFLSRKENFFKQERETLQAEMVHYFSKRFHLGDEDKAHPELLEHLYQGYFQ